MSLDRALAWAAAGYYVFPARVAQEPDGTWSKRPLTPNGHKDATTDPAQVRELWAHGARVAQVGVAVEASGLVVVDVDPRNGGERPDLPETHTVTTVSGGEHLYYRGATDRRSPWTGVDLKRNGFVVAYADPPRLRTLPRWSDGYLGNGSVWTDVVPSGTGRDFIAEAEAGFSEGSRNSDLWSYAGALRRAQPDMPVDEAEECLAQAAARCSPPYEEWQARDMARRAWDAYEPGPGREADAWERWEAERLAEPVPAVTVGEDGTEWVEIVLPRRERLLRQRALSVEDLMDMPRVKWLVAGLVQEGATAQLIGPSGGGKSLLALQWGMELAHEGRRVLYAAAEGLGGFRGRVKAYFAHHGPRDVSERLWFYPMALDLFDRERSEDFLAWCEDTGPWDLVVVDTMARAMPGAEENSARDTGIVIKAAEDLKRRVDGTVLLVHHTGHEGTRGRGSSAVFAAQDNVVHAIPQEGGPLKVWAPKVKDGRKAEPAYYQLHEVTLGAFRGDEYVDQAGPGDDVWTSVVLVPTSEPDAGIEAKVRAALNADIPWSKARYAWEGPKRKEAKVVWDRLAGVGAAREDDE